MIPPEQMQSIIDIIGQIILFVLSGISGGMVFKVTARAQEKNYKELFEKAIKRAYDLGAQLDKLEVIVKDQNTQIENQKMASLVAANNLENLSRDRETLRLERDEYMKSWGKLETELRVMQNGQQSYSDRIKSLEKQVEQLTDQLKEANSWLTELRENYQKVVGEKERLENKVVSLEGQLKRENQP